jgi:hypothetical protein
MEAPPPSTLKQACPYHLIFIPCSPSAPANIDPAARVHHFAVPRILPTSSIVANTTKTASKPSPTLDAPLSVSRARNPGLGNYVFPEPLRTYYKSWRYRSTPPFFAATTRVLVSSYGLPGLPAQPDVPRCAAVARAGAARRDDPPDRPGTDAPSGGRGIAPQPGCQGAPKARVRARARQSRATRDSGIERSSSRWVGAYSTPDKAQRES